MRSGGVVGAPGDTGIEFYEELLARDARLSEAVTCVTSHHTVVDRVHATDTVYCYNGAFIYYATWKGGLGMVRSASPPSQLQKTV